MKKLFCIAVLMGLFAVGCDNADDANPVTTDGTESAVSVPAPGTEPVPGE